MSSGGVRAFLDRFEGQNAVLLVGDDERQSILLPKDLLPEDAKSGDVFVVSIEHDVQETRRASDEVRDLIEDLTKGNG